VWGVRDSGEKMKQERRDVRKRCGTWAAMGVGKVVFGLSLCLGPEIAGLCAVEAHHRLSAKFLVHTCAT